jgi:hypothetical protein
MQVPSVRKRRFHSESPFMFLYRLAWERIVQICAVQCEHAGANQTLFISVMAQLHEPLAKSSPDEL